MYLATTKHRENMAPKMEGEYQKTKDERVMLEIRRSDEMKWDQIGSTKLVPTPCDIFVRHYDKLYVNIIYIIMML